MSFNNVNRPDGNIGELNQKLHEAYDDIVKSVPSAVGSILKMENLDRPHGLFTFWDSVPHPRKWEGSRVAQNVKLQSVPVKSVPHELTVEMDKDEYRSATFSSLINKLESIAAAQSRLADREVARVLAEGSSTNGYDGVPIFSAAHPRNNGLANQSNLIGSSALNLTNLIAAYNRMAGFTDAEGEPLLLKPTTVVVPSQLALQAKDIINSTLVGGGNSNVLNGLGLDIVVLPELDKYSTTSWYLLSGSPITHFVFEPAHFDIFDGDKDEPVFNRRKVLLGWSASFETQIGLWQPVLKCNA